MTPDELVERVATAIARAYVSDVSGGHLCLEDSEYHWSDWRVEARAAIAVVLGEAAKTVDQMPLSHPGNAAETALECAAAIRAMIPHD